MPTRPQVYLRLVFFLGGGALEKIGKILKILEKMDIILKKNLEQIVHNGTKFWPVVFGGGGGGGGGVGRPPPLNPFLLCTINKQINVRIAAMSLRKTT